MNINEDLLEQMKNPRLKGIVASERDSRDFVYATMKEMRTDLPSKFELATHEVLDQGKSGTCVGFGSVVSQEMDALVRYPNKKSRLSQLFLYNLCKQIDGIKNEGTTIKDALKVLQRYGVCESDLYPYIDNTDTMNLKFPQIKPEHYENASKYKISSYAQVFSVNEVKNAIYNENGSIVGFQVFDSFLNAVDGFVGKIEGKYHGGHCVCFVGWDDNLEKVIGGVKYKGFLKFKNSWGIKWGNKGYGYLAYDLFNHATADGWFKLLMEAWTTVDDIEPEDVPNLNYHKDIFNEKRQQDNVNLDINIEMTINNKNYKVNGKNQVLDVPPTIIDGRTVVPLRALSEIFGANISYDNKTKRITIKENIESLRKAIEKYN